MDKRKLTQLVALFPLVKLIVSWLTNFLIYFWAKSKFVSGSGKTYTMEGPGQDKKDNGISYRTIQKIINMLHHREQKQKFAIRKQMASTNDNNPSVEDMARDTLPQFTFSMTVGMLEIYNDEIFDLLVEPGKLNRGDKPEKKKLGY